MLKNKLNRAVVLEILGLIVLLCVTLFLRFPNLGYSDYIGDEHKSFIRLGEGDTLYGFFMEQRKGPMQYLVSYIPQIFVGNFRNELVQRLPFTLFGVASVFVFYFFIKKITNNKITALLASLLFSANGFILAFARISQYQNLNLFFSFLALYFYADFLKPNEKLMRNTIFGTASFALSLLSHWDAVFVLVPIIYFFVTFLKNKELDFEYKKRIVLNNLFWGGILLLPFLVPYIIHQMYDAANKEYFTRRVSPGVFAIQGYTQLIHLYNPFLVLEFVLSTSLIGLLGRRSWLFFLWFLVNYATFQFFVQKPGTHIYNFIIPLLILSALGISLLIEYLPKYIKVIPVILFLAFYSFFVYQDYMIYIDHKVEYPWAKEQLGSFVCKGKADGYKLFFNVSCKDFLAYFKTPTYRLEDKLPLFGFPFSRNWNEINDFVNEQNKLRNENFGYTTNELKTIAEKYMDAKYKTNNGFYVVAIRMPFSFVEDWSFGKYPSKQLVKEFYKDDRAVVRIYRVEPGKE